MTEEVEKKPSETNQGFNAGLFIPAGIFLGMAYGFYTNNLVVGISAGLGHGFLFMLITSMIFGAKGK